MSNQYNILDYCTVQTYLNIPLMSCRDNPSISRQLSRALNISCRIGTRHSSSIGMFLNLTLPFTSCGVNFSNVVWQMFEICRRFLPLHSDFHFTVLANCVDLANILMTVLLQFKFVWWNLTNRLHNRV